MLTRFKKWLHHVGRWPEEARIRRLTSAYRIGEGGWRRIYFYHMQKAGGSSLNKMFMDISGVPSDDVYRQIVRHPRHRVVAGDKVYVGWLKEYIEGGRYFFAYSHIAAHELRLPPETFTFTCLRHPIKRLLSYYKERLHFARNKPDHHHTQRIQDWFSEDFDTFITQAPKPLLMPQLYMFSAQFDPDEALAGILNCNHFFLTEETDKGVAQMSRLLQLPLSPRHDRQAQLDFTPSEAQLERMQALLQPEIALYTRAAEIYHQRNNDA